MRKIIGYTLAALLMIAGTAAGIATSAVIAAGSTNGDDLPTIDQLLEKYADARGGASRWKKLSSMEWTGTGTTFSVTAPFTLTLKRPDLYRFERTIMTRPVVIGYDGETAWWSNPLMGADWAVEVPLPEAAVIRHEADLEGPLFNSRGKGHQVEFVGLGDVDGEPAYELKVTLKDGAEETWYIDPDSYVEIARLSSGADFGRSMEKWTYFSDFRKVNGLVLPHRIEMEFGNRHEVLSLEKVRVDLDIDDARFRMPVSEEMEPLMPLAGDWKLTVAQRPYPQAPWRETETGSTITSLLDGRLLEEHFGFEDRGVRTEIVRTWSYDRFKKTYRLTQIDSFTAHQSVMEGTFEENDLVVSNIETGTPWVSGDESYHTRCTLKEIGPDKFQIDSETSNDGGENWFNDTRYTYSRK